MALPEKYVYHNNIQEAQDARHSDQLHTSASRATYAPSPLPPSLSP